MLRIGIFGVHGFWVMTQKKCLVSETTHDNLIGLIFLILKFRNIGRSTFDHSKFSTPLKMISKQSTLLQDKYRFSHVWHLFFLDAGWRSVVKYIWNGYYVSRDAMRIVPSSSSSSHETLFRSRNDVWSSTFSF